jgi:WD40 repeat protein
VLTSSITTVSEPPRHFNLAPPINALVVGLIMRQARVEMEPVQVLKFDLFTDCVEFGPAIDELKLAVGMYRLDDSTQQREGRISFYRQQDGQLVLEKSVGLLGGVLDMKWLDGEALIIAASDGLLQVDSRGILWHFQSAEMLLCLDITPNLAVTSSSQGRLGVFDIKAQAMIQEWKAHDLETWSVAFNATSPDLVYSGADDGLIRAWDRRSTSSPVLTNRHHQAGVCSVISSGEYLFSGSYDMRLCKFDLRAPCTALAECAFASGVWRLKLCDRSLLAACMHDGFNVVDVASDGFQAYRLGSSDSLAYGCSWSPNGHHAAGASFYDATVQIWSIDA